MGSQRNPNSGNLKDILKRIYKLEHAAPMNNAAIGRDGLLVYDGGVITIENGGLNITGSATISGTLDVSGTTNLSGVNNLSGENHLTGPTDVAGNFEIISGGLFKAGESVINPDGSAAFGLFDIAANGDLASKGALSIEGPTTLENDLDVTEGGKITVGNVILSPDAANGGVEFASGGGIGGNAGGVVMRGSANAGFMALSDTSSAMFAGSTQLTLATTGLTLSSPLNKINGETHFGNAIKFENPWVVFAALPTNSSAPNLYVNPSGVLYRSTYVP